MGRISWNWSGSNSARILIKISWAQTVLTWSLSGPNFFKPSVFGDLRVFRAFRSLLYIGSLSSYRIFLALQVCFRTTSSTPQAFGRRLSKIASKKFPAWQILRKVQIRVLRWQHSSSWPHSSSPSSSSGPTWWLTWRWCGPWRLRSSSRFLPASRKRIRRQISIVSSGSCVWLDHSSSLLCHLWTCSRGRVRFLSWWGASEQRQAWVPGSWRETTILCH